MSTFDDQVNAKLANQLDENTAQKLNSAYGFVNSHIGQEVLSYIRGKEPNLTDHDMTHIENVKKNVMSLLPSNGCPNALTGVEMYLLGMFILFHDAGNFFGRSGHQNRVAEIFDKLRPGNDGYVRHEKSLVVTATRAHTGLGRGGSKDTLKDISETDQHFGKPVRLRELAAILRFSDELAEGPQRTSQFAQEADYFSEEASMYHTYATSTNILIDRGSGRIEVSYEIQLDAECHPNGRKDRFSEIIKFFYGRLIKLNQERQYATHYSEMLKPFTSTYARFNFHYQSMILEANLEPLRLTDLVVPGEPTKDIAEVDASYGIDRLVPRLLDQCDVPTQKSGWFLSIIRRFAHKGVAK